VSGRSDHAPCRLRAGPSRGPARPGDPGGLRPGGVALFYDTRRFAYTSNELKVSRAGGPSGDLHVEREVAGSTLLAVFFVRIRLVRPSAA